MPLLPRNQIRLFACNCFAWIHGGTDEYILSIYTMALQYLSVGTFLKLIVYAMYWTRKVCRSHGVVCIPLPTSSKDMRL